MAYKAITLTALIVGTKGGPGSGNRGHAGRPGKLGGSVGKGAGLSLPPGVTFYGGFPEQFTKNYNLTQADVANMFKVDGIQTEIKIEDTFVGGTDDNAMRVEITWRDPTQGEYAFVGNAIRVFTTVEGEKFCNNSLLGIGKQNTGIGAKLYEQQMPILKQAGFTAVITHADSDIGRYAWARQGFTYTYGQKVADNKTERFRKWTAKKGIPLDPNFKATTPQDFANFKVPGLKLSGAQITNSSVPDTLMMEVGKAFMLDQAPNAHADWDGILMLK